MSLRSQVHLLVDAIALPIHISREHAGHLVVVTFIRQNKRTDVEIEFHQIEGGVKATSYLCLLGIGIGLTSYLVYKLYAYVLPTCRTRLTTLVSRLKQKQPEHTCNDSAVDVAFVPQKAHSDVRLPTKAHSTCGEICHAQRPFSCNASHAGSELVLHSGRLHSSCPRTTTDVTEWLLGNRSPYRSDGAPLGKIQKERMRWKSLGSSKSRDLGFVSSNLISTMSGFYTQSLDRELDNRVAAGNFRSRQNNDACFAPPDDDEILSYLDASNNNVSSATRSNRLSIATESQSMTTSGVSLDRGGGRQFGQIHQPLNYTAFEGIDSRFHSTPEYTGNPDHDGHKRKGSINARSVGRGSCGSGGSMTSDQSRRESVVSNTFTRTSLSDMDSPVSEEVFEAEASALIGRATLSDMDQLQSQLQLITDDIGNLNEQMEVLQLREDPKTVVARRYTLGTTEAVSRLRCRPQRRHRRATSNVFSHSCGFPFRIDEESTAVAASANNRSDPDVDFLWDYQSEFDGNAQRNEDDMFVIHAPLDETNSYDSYSVPPSSNSCHSLNSDASVGDYENLHWVEKQSLADDSRDENQVQANTTDMYIDDDLTGLEDDEFKFVAQRYQEPVSQSSDLPPIAMKGHKHLFSNLLDFQQTPGSSAVANAETTHENEAQTLRTCANCGNNVNVINNNVNINMNLQVPNMETVFHASVNPADVPGFEKMRCPDFVFSAGPSGCGRAKQDQANRLSQWEVENVGEKHSFFQYINSEVFRHKCKSQQSTREGYLEVRKLFGLTYIRTIRSDNYSALRTVLYQVLVNNVAITKTIGSSQETITRLTVFADPRYEYLRTWNFANRLPYVRGMVTETLVDCINCLHLQIEVLSHMKNLAEREQYLSSLLNHSPEIDLKLLEAVKALMMIKAIELYDKFCVSRFSVPTFVWLMFSRYMTIDPEMLLHNWINPLGDSACLQKPEMHLLGTTLGVKIEVIRPCHFEDEDFIAHYPDEGADSFEKVTIVEEDDNRYSVLMA